MRWRDPLLYHDQIGKHEDPSEARFARPGEKYSDTLIRQTEELAFQNRVKAEQEKAAANEEEEVSAL